jgi:hypothetical protein
MDPIPAYVETSRVARTGFTLISTLERSMIGMVMRKIRLTSDRGPQHSITATSPTFVAG